MKICQVLATFPYHEQLTGEISGGRYRVGGIGQYVYSLTTELVNLGDSVTIIAPRAPQHKLLTEIELDGVDIRRVSPFISVYSASLPLGVFKSLTTDEYDIVHAHTPVPAIAELAALRIMNKEIPYILNYHNDVVKAGSLGWILSNIYSFTLGPFLLKRADVIITLTESLAANSKRLSKYLNKIKIVPGGVNPERFRQNSDPSRIRNKHSLGPEAKVILFVGILDAYKGCDYLIRAMPGIIHEIPEAQLIFVGTGPMGKDLKATAVKLGINSNVIFAGFVPDEDLPYYYSACDAFVLPSVSAEEGFGLVQLEAMASGKPVITTTIPGVCEVDAEEVATIHVPPRNIEALADATIKILQDKDSAARFGNGGRKLVESKYTWAKVAHAMQEVYLEASDNKRQRGVSVK